MKENKPFNSSIMALVLMCNYTSILSFKVPDAKIYLPFVKETLQNAREWSSCGWCMYDVPSFKLTHLTFTQIVDNLLKEFDQQAM